MNNRIFLLSTTLFLFIGISHQARATVACCYSGGECAEAITAQQCRNTGGSPANAATCDPNPCGNLSTNTSTEQIIKEEAITIADLEIDEPSLLPSSPFYFFKNIARGIRQAFTFNPIKKTELELRFADEKLAETKKLAEIDPEKTDAIEHAIENYRASQEKLKTRLESLKETSKNPNVDKLLEKLADRTIKHEKLFAELEEKFEGKKELEKQFEQVKEELEKNIAKAGEKDDPDKFAKKIERALVEVRGSDLKHVRSLEILDRIHQKAPEELKKELSKISEDFSKRLKEDLEAFVKKHEATPELIQETLKELPGEKARRLIIIEELQEKAERRVKEALKASEKVLEKVFEEREELEERAKEAIEHAKKRIEELNTAIKEIEKETSVEEAIRAATAVQQLKIEAIRHIDEAVRIYESKKYGEAFGQARSAEVLARNALHMLEKREEPRDKDLKEDISELEERLNGWERRIDRLSEELKEKAEVTLKNFRKHIDLARDALNREALKETKGYINQAKRFERILERIFEASDKGKAAPALSPTDAQTTCPIADLLTCKEDNASEECVQEIKILAGKFPQCGFERLLAPKKSSERAPMKIKPHSEIICTQEYNPVCAEVSKDVYKTYSNGCFARVANARVVYVGECGAKEKIWGDPLGENGIRIAPPPAAESKKPAVAPKADQAEIKELTPSISSSGSQDRTIEPVALKFEADDNGFYPQNSLTVAKGAKVSLMFMVRKEGVYYGGLDFRSSKFKTATVKPGESTSVEFVADESFKITSYWPLTETYKATLVVEVK